MSNLAALLQRLNYHQARRMARTLGVTQPGADRIEHWRAAVATHWADPVRAAQTIAQLPAPARRALERLLALGAAPLRLVLGEYGSLRLQRPRREPPSVAELLYEHGLLHPADDQPWSRCSRLLVPPDLRASLQELLIATPERVPASDAAPAPTGENDTPPALLHDLSQLLIFCLTPAVTQKPARRWLKPGELRRFNQRLLHPLPLSPRATHKQTPYLRLLALLASAARLLADGTPTAAAWRWLAAEPPVQWQVLVHAWRDAGAALRERYTVDGEPPTPPAPWLPILLRHLAQQPGPWTPQALADHLLGQEPALNAFFAAHFASLTDVDEAIAHLCAGPLAWLSVVEPLPAQHLDATPLADARLAPAHQLYRTTPYARWLVAPEPAHPPAWRWRNGGAQRQDDDEQPAWWLWLPWATPPALMARVACYAEYRGTQQTAGLRHGFCLTPHSLATAAAAGHGLPALLDALAALELPLAPAQLGQLHRWHASGGWPRLQVLPVLRAANRTQLAHLYNDPQVAKLLGDPLNSTTATWRGDQEVLIRQLQAAGYAPVVGMTAPGPNLDEAAGQAGALWLAAQLYTALGRHLALPFALPSALVDSLYGQLDGAQQAWLQAQLDHLVQQVDEVVDGLTPLPSPYPSDPATWRPLLAATVSADEPVELLYWSAGRGLLTYRRVQPRWISERRGVEYLRAECLVSGRSLHFRLDRIVALVRVSRPADEGETPLTE